MTALVGVALVVVAFAGCGSDGDAEDINAQADAESAELTYRFNDASVPPEYHRSYVVTASDGSVQIVVDSYGDILHDEQAPLDQATFQSVLDRLDDLVADEQSDDDDEGCTGGTSSELTVADADGVVITDLSTTSCGGSDQASAQLSEAVEPLLAGFDMGELLAPSE